MDLDEWRSRINNLDEEILTLLNQRGQAALQIGEFKRQQDLPYFAPGRESQILDRLVALTLDRYQRVDILVNNASELGPTPLPYLADYPPAVFVDVLQVNLAAPFHLTQALIGHMLLRDTGNTNVTTLHDPIGE